MSHPSAECHEHHVCLGPWFTARYEGRCACCGCEIGEGDEIRAAGGYADGYLCSDCGGE